MSNDFKASQKKKFTGMSLSASTSPLVVLIFNIGVILTLIGVFPLFSYFIQGNDGDRLKPSILTSARATIRMIDKPLDKTYLKSW